MKICTKCKENKELDNFAKRSDRPGKHHSWCKVCCYKHVNSTYKDRPERRQRLKEWTKEYQRRNEEYVVNYLKSNPCHCGESSILALQFDHLRDKEFEVSIGVMKGYSLERIKAEIEKCQVLCANCHSKKTAYQLKSWRLKWLATSDSN